jgi:hypothetical protein
MTTGLTQTRQIERNRLRTANRYLKRISYGNRKPLLLDINKPSFRKLHTELIDFSSVGWMFELVFDYGEDHYRTLAPDASKSESEQHRLVQASASSGGTWSSRPDPFSLYRSGFEVRTYRRCQRALMFHRFQELAGEQADGNTEPSAMPYLVRSTEFIYSDLDYSQSVEVEKELEYKGSTRFASFIRAVTQSGYVRDESLPVLKQNGAKYLIYIKKSLPPLEFDYSQAIIQEDIKDIDADSLENLPYGLDGSIYQWADLDGEGVSGILTEQAETWFYKANLGGGKFGPMVRLTAKPSLAALGGGRQQFLDLAGDGHLDLVMMEGSVQGFYERTDDYGWDNFTPFSSIPNIPWRDPNLRFIDVTGDGHADIIISEDNALTWYPSLAEDGFGPAERVRQALDEEKGPRLVFEDGTQSIYIADMSGDGLNDLVRIRNGGVSYWPNLGYGRFGPKVSMDNSPWFDSVEQFNQKRIRLADIDGSGTNDIIYLGRDGVRLYFNQSGNRWSGPRRLRQFPSVDSLSSVMTADLLGNGTACLVWSSPLPAVAGPAMRYIDLMGGQKPHLLIKSVNNLGAETIVSYTPSTKFYLADKLAGKPWITKIPFPVHVVERVETYDRISRNRFVTRYAYHHGYFDGIEREFRGFGMVEQWDTEKFAALSASDSFPVGDNIDVATHVPPVHTKTWFHTGAYFEGEAISRHLEEEYYSEGDPSMGETSLSEEQLESMLLDDTVLPGKLSAEERLEACRSLKGAMLRQEIYALDQRPDGTPAEESDRPYSASERNYTIKLLQPRGNNEHAIFFTHARETIDFHYERKLFKVVGNTLADPIAPPSNAKNAADPRVTHAITLAVDDYGNVLRSVAIGYGRRFKDPALTLQDQEKQTKMLITLSENRYTNAIVENDAYRAPLPSEASTYEVLKAAPSAAPAGVTPLFRFDKLQELVEGDEFSQGSWDIPYKDVKHSQATESHPYRRLIEHARTLYCSNQIDRLLPLGNVHSLALPGESYKLAFTPGLVKEIYGGKVTDAILETEGRYVHSQGEVSWWIPSGRAYYSPGSEDTSAQELAYACQHFFLPHRYRDPFHTKEASTESFVSYDAHDLLMKETRDALDNCVTVGERKPNGDLDLTKPGNDYRVLQPCLVMDPNRNRTAVAFDALGMVVGTAVMGKPEDSPQQGDLLDTAFRTDLTQAEIDKFIANPKGPMAASLLGKATTRIVYDLTSYWREHDPEKKPPAFAATLARETHVSDPVPVGGLRIQVSLSYSDGFGREIQKKIQAEPGAVPRRDPVTGKITTDPSGQPGMTEIDVSPRWVGSGWTVFNNKGKPVRQYEPFFTDTHRFEFDVRIGVSPVLFYDPVERVIGTIHPNHTWEKVVFDPWHQLTYDVNDTIKTDPRTDEDISGYVQEYFRRVAPKNRKTWLGERGVDPQSPLQDTPGLEPEKKAAVRTLIHADTPTVAHFDTLGRTFLTVAHNRFKYSNSSPADPPAEEFYPTRILFDIEGNQREVIDAKLDPATKRGRIVMRYDYDMLGNRVHQASMEAGERWMLNDVAGNPIRAWDSRDHQFRSAYDPLRRPTESYLLEGGTAEMLVERTIYGEVQIDAEAKNLRGKVYQLYDQAGLVSKEEYDFKGNLLHSSRQLAAEYKKTLNWPTTITPELLEAETFTSSTIFDALNRPIQVVAPHSSNAGSKLNVIQPAYNGANLLERLEVWLKRDEKPDGLLDPATATQHAVKNIDYDAKGQRLFIEY